VSAQIGLEIKLLRERLKLSAKDLAERVGLSPSQMSRLESGQRRVDAVLLSKIARALDVHPSHFFPDFEAPAAEDAAPARAEAGPGAEVVVEPVPHLGRLIRSERRRRHVTAEELAQRIGKGRSFLRDLEKGETDLVTAETLQKIAKALKFDPEALLDAQRHEISELRRNMARLARAHTQKTLGTIELGEGEPRPGLPVVEDDAGGLPHRFEDGAPQGRIVDYVYFPALRVQQAFCVEWRGDEMQSRTSPSFASGEVLVFAGDRGARHRDFVLAVLPGRSLFRQLFMEAKGLRLQPLNLDYPPLMLDRDEVQELFVLVARLGTF